MKEQITEIQKEILGFIERFHTRNRYSPSIRDICTGTDRKSPSTVHRHVELLIQHGYLKRVDKSPRALRLVNEKVRPDIATMKHHDRLLVAIFGELREAVGD
jgi:repressor LexA